jgi:hypothetical protein
MVTAPSTLLGALAGYFRVPHCRAQWILELNRDRFSFVTPDERREILSSTVQRVWPFGLEDNSATAPR